ncbi:uncharacterized protein LOC141691385 [Apium graveolens]|uniref:uncharacterized protein LOC141691385 n=1 Tax=Apium graveolens TaxID=4045 RepID=UPI003D79CB89
MAQPDRYSNNCPPLLQGAENYNDWKFLMKIFLQRDAFEWDAIKNGFTIPMKDGKPKYLKELSLKEVNAMNSNAKDMNSLFNGMVATELQKVSACTTAKQSWNTIKVSQEGTSKVREVKLSMPMSDHEGFRLERDESVRDAQGRFLTLMNSISLLEMIILQSEINRKILRAMQKKFAPKVTILQDSTLLSTMDTLTLFTELEEFENQLRIYDEEDEAPRKKTLALNAEANESPDDFDEEIALLTKKFHKFLAKRNASKRPMKSQFPKKDFKSNPSKENKANQSKDTCFECEKKGHFKKDGYKLNNKKKALITWSDDESDIEIDSGDEVAQLCFAGLEDSSGDNDEDQNRKLKEKNAYLKQELSEVLSEMDDPMKDKESVSVDPETVKRDSVTDPLGHTPMKRLCGYKRAPMKYKMPYEKYRDFGKSGHTTSESRLCGIKGHSSNSSYRSSTRYKSANASVNIVQMWIKKSDRHLYKICDTNLKGPKVKWVHKRYNNFCSVSQLTDAGHKVNFDKYVYYIGTQSNEFAVVAKRKGNILVLDFDEQQEEICLSTVQEQQNLWYRRLGHVHMDLLRKISSHGLVRGLLKLKYKKVEPCSACQLGKQVKTSFV